MRFGRVVSCFLMAFAGLAFAPLATAQIDGISITPTQTCVFQGPEGGPFSPTSCDLSLVNSTAAPVQVDASFFVNWNPAWISGTINGQAITGSTAQRITVPANGSLPMRLSLTEGVSTVTNDSSDRIGGFNIADVDVPQRALSAIGRLQFTAGNDSFSSARLIDRVVFTIGGDNNGATKEAGEPNHAGNAGGASVWFRYDVPPAASGTVEFNTNFSSFDTLLAVYTGNAVSGLTQVAANDNASSGVTTSAVSFTVTPGQTYFIAIDGASSNGGAAATGFYQLNMRETFTILNDAFANAVTLSGASGTTSQFANQLVQTTRETGEPSHGGGGGGSVWYRWTAPSTGHYQISAGAPGIGNFPVIAVYLGDAVSDLTEIASNTILASATNTVDFTAVEGAEYRIAFAGTMFANYPINWGTVSSPNPLGLFSSILPASRAVGFGQTAGVFANMLNSTTETGRNCRPEAPNMLSDITPNGFVYVRANAENVQVGEINTPIDIPPGAVQNWVLNISRGVAISSGRVGIRFVCDNLAPAPIYPAANTWVLRVLNPAPADIIAIGATNGAIPGVVDLPVGGLAAFATAGINIGPTSSIVVTPQSTFGSSVSLTVCQTNASAECLSPPTPSLTIPAYLEAASQADVRTFSVFVQSNGQPIAFNPGLNRLILNFTQAGTLVGATSVAVRTLAEPS